MTLLSACVALAGSASEDYALRRSSVGAEVVRREEGRGETKRERFFKKMWKEGVRSEKKAGSQREETRAEKG